MNPYFWVKFFLVLSATLYLLSMAVSIFLQIDKIELSEERFNRESKCPLCYGKSLCNKLKSFKLESTVLSDDTYLFHSLFNVKNVYFATFNYFQRVVVKKLAHNDELNEFDKFEKTCAKTDSQKCISKILHSKYKFLSPHTFSPQMMNIEFATCFSDRLVDWMSKNYKENESTDRKLTDMSLLTTLMINPEPILLQVCILLVFFLALLIIYFSNNRCSPRAKAGHFQNILAHVVV